MHLKKLFKKGVDCYIINTGSFLGNDITPGVTLYTIEQNVDGEAEFEQFGPVEGLEYVRVEGYEVPFNDDKYIGRLRSNMQTRVEHVKKALAVAEAPSKLPDEIALSIQNIVD